LIGADLEVMRRDSLKMRGEGPFLFAQVKNGQGVAEIADHVLKAWKFAISKAQVNGN
jgi:urease accessory protein